MVAGIIADMAVEIVNKGAELLGSMAISEDFPYEKCLRDAKVTQLWLGGTGKPKFLGQPSGVCW